MATPTLDRDTILEAVRQLPPEEQVAIAREILRDAGAVRAQRPPQRPGWRQMAGLAAVPGQEPPSDEQVAHWLDEHRTQKYGS